MKCPYCDQEHPDGAKFCPESGKMLRRNCPNCKKEVGTEIQFCPFCGLNFLNKFDGNDFRNKTQRFENKRTVPFPVLVFIVILGIIIISFGGLYFTDNLPGEFEKLVGLHKPTENIEVVAENNEIIMTETPDQIEEVILSTEPIPSPAIEEITSTADVTEETKLSPGSEIDEAYAGDYSGNVIKVLYFNTSEEGKKFRENYFLDFENVTGIDIQFVYSSNYLDTIIEGIETNNLINIAHFSPLSHLRPFVEKGLIKDLSTAINPIWLNLYYPQSLIDITKINDSNGEILAGVWDRVSTDSKIWYSKSQFRSAGYEVPETWDDLILLSDQIVDDGGTPWCIGAGAKEEESTGWITAEWIEEIMLRSTSLGNYDKWIAGEIKFDSPEVRFAIEKLSEIWFKDNFVFGGRYSINKIYWGNAPAPLFSNPPGCWLHLDGPGIDLFYSTPISSDDYDFFYFPSINFMYGKPIRINGSIYSIVNDSPESRALIQYIVNKNFPIRNDDILLSSTAMRGESSGIMPYSVQKAFWKNISLYVDNIIDLDTALSNIDDSWE